MIPAGTPGWRRPGSASLALPAERRASELRSLADAIRQLLPRTHAELPAAVREDWGACSDAQFDAALSALVRRGVIRLVGGEYVLAGGGR